MCRSQSSWFRCRLLTKINLITSEDHSLQVHFIDWGMERQIHLSGFIHFFFFFICLPFLSFRSSRNSSIVCFSSLFTNRFVFFSFSLTRQPICCVQCRLAGVNNGSLANVTRLSAWRYPAYPRVRPNHTEIVAWCFPLGERIAHASLLSKLGFCPHLFLSSCLSLSPSFSMWRVSFSVVCLFVYSLCVFHQAFSVCESLVVFLLSFLLQNLNLYSNVVS